MGSINSSNFLQCHCFSVIGKAPAASKSGNHHIRKSSKQYAPAKESCFPHILSSLRTIWTNVFDQWNFNHIWMPGAFKSEKCTFQPLSYPPTEAGVGVKKKLICYLAIHPSISTYLHLWQLALSTQPHNLDISAIFFFVSINTSKWLSEFFLAMFINPGFGVEKSDA